MLVVDPWHWLQADGALPPTGSRSRSQMIRVARVIEYGGPLPAGSARETLLECSRRSSSRRCDGMLWVTKLTDDALLAFCATCKGEHMLVHNWQKTKWARGLGPPVRMKRT